MRKHDREYLEAQSRLCEHWRDMYQCRLCNDENFVPHWDLGKGE